MTTKTTTILTCCVSMSLLAALAPAARADDAAPAPAPALAPAAPAADATPAPTLPPAAPATDAGPAPSLHPGVGGHVGVAIPLVFLRSADPGNQTISDQFNLAFPIGIGFNLTEKIALDLETVVGNPIRPRGTTGVTIDPGVVYNAGPVVLGVRIGWDIGAPTNFKVIPLIHKGIAPIGAGATWFVEAAFPVTFVFTTTPENKANTELDIVFHTGIGF
jgi:hypothetical protein